MMVGVSLSWGAERFGGCGVVRTGGLLRLQPVKSLFAIGLSRRGCGCRLHGVFVESVGSILVWSCGHDFLGGSDITGFDGNNTCVQGSCIGK